MLKLKARFLNFDTATRECDDIYGTHRGLCTDRAVLYRGDTVVSEHRADKHDREK